MTEKAEPQVTVFVCGPQRCSDGGEHDDLARVTLYDSQGRPNGESVACSKCGSSAFDRDLWGAP